MSHAHHDSMTGQGTAWPRPARENKPTRGGFWDTSALQPARVREDGLVRYVVLKRQLTHLSSKAHPAQLDITTADRSAAYPHEGQQSRKNQETTRQSTLPCHCEKSSTVAVGTVNEISRACIHDSFQFLRVAVAHELRLLFWPTLRTKKLHWTH